MTYRDRFKAMVHKYNGENDEYTDALMKTIEQPYVDAIIEVLLKESKSTKEDEDEDR